MLRVVLWLVGAVVVISLLRGIIGMFGKLVGDFMTSPTANSPKRTQGSLQKCPGCGTFTPGGEYCSPECRQKTKAAGI